MRYNRTGQKWSFREEELLRRLFFQGKSINVISQELRREKMKKVIFTIILIGVIILSGCDSLTFTQELDSTPDNKLIISAKVSDNADIRGVSDAIKEINCKFKAEESKKESDTYLTYTSENCVLSGVEINKLDKNVYKYTFDSSTFKQYASDITYVTYIIKIVGNIIDTNGINIGNNQVKFLVSSEDIANKYVYFVEYSLYCKYDSECTSDEACKGIQRCEDHNCYELKCSDREVSVNHECQLLNCGFFKKPSNHQCVNNLLTITLTGMITLLIFVSVAIFLYLTHKKKHKKSDKK